MGTNNGTKTRYSDSELLEFKELILKKLGPAKSDRDLYLELFRTTFGQDKEMNDKHYQDEVKFIKHLDDALIRIENKTYGICRETGELISKERLRAVPHATTSVDGKKVANGRPLAAAWR